MRGTGTTKQVISRRASFRTLRHVVQAKPFQKSRDSLDRRSSIAVNLDSWMSRGRSQPVFFRVGLSQPRAASTTT